MSAFPIETGRLLLRPFTMDDLDAIHAIWSDPQVMWWIPSGAFRSIDRSRIMLRALIRHQEENGFSLWAVIEKESSELIGETGLFLEGGAGPDVELVYRFARSAWGKGYAPEAARACLEFGLDWLGLERIIAIIPVRHAASRRVVEKIGMEYEGTKRYFGREMAVYVRGHCDDRERIGIRE